jgi:Nucleotidyl transferase AbiEii toxin, Type IV TA system
MGSPENVLARLQQAGQRDLGDAFAFALAPDRAHTEIEGDGIVYEGKRFTAQCKIAGVSYGMPFGVDAGFGDVLTEEPELIAGTSFFDFVGASPAQHRVYPRVAHIAEKLHAYTLPRRNENSRVKDLPDLALLAKTGAFAAQDIRVAIDATFGFRKTHDVPAMLPPPPESWTAVYQRMANADDLPWKTLDSVFAAAGTFLDPVLRGDNAQWDPKSESWSAR